MWWVVLFLDDSGVSREAEPGWRPGRSLGRPLPPACPASSLVASLGSSRHCPTLSGISQAFGEWGIGVLLPSGPPGLPAGGPSHWRWRDRVRLPPSLTPAPTQAQRSQGLVQGHTASPGEALRGCRGPRFLTPQAADWATRFMPHRSVTPKRKALRVTDDKHKPKGLVSLESGASRMGGMN